MKKIIVTTSIHKITDAVARFQAFQDWDLVVVGDLKTPKDYQLERGTYLSPEEQNKYDSDLSEAIGWNCIQRRNFGLLWAYDHGADIVATVDDDNIPADEWGRELMIGRPVEVRVFDCDLPVFDPIGATNESRLWHRGFPFQLVARRKYGTPVSERLTFDIQADFWDGDPDIDAVCRMIYRPDCRFDPAAFPFASRQMSPFNSQNTFLSRDCLKDYFLFPHIGRMDDIWASLYLQAKGRHVIYNRATVFQARNEHDLTKDMQAEYSGYEKTLPLVEALKQDPESIRRFLPESSWRAFEIYRRHFK